MAEGPLFWYFFKIFNQVRTRQSKKTSFFSFVKIKRADNSGHCNDLAAAVEERSAGWKNFNVQQLTGAITALSFDKGHHCIQSSKGTIEQGVYQTVEEGGFFIAFKVGAGTNHSPVFSRVEAGKIYELSTIKPPRFGGLFHGDEGLQIKVVDDPRYQPSAEDENAEAAEGEGKEAAAGENAEAAEGEKEAEASE